MAIQYLKRSKSETEKAEEDAKVRGVVERTLADIETKGDAAIRELSQKFDNYFRHTIYEASQNFPTLTGQHWKIVTGQSQLHHLKFYSIKIIYFKILF